MSSDNPQNPDDSVSNMADGASKPTDNIVSVPVLRLAEIRLQEEDEIQQDDLLSPETLELDFSEGSFSPDQPPNLIINYMPYDMVERDLEELFKGYGRIIETKVVRDRVTRKSKGFGFVLFENHEAAMKAIDDLNRKEIGEKKLKVSYARPACDAIKNCKLHVSNIPSNVTEEDVRALFQSCGNIIEWRVVHQNHTPRQEAEKFVLFVQFNVRDEANQALALNGYCFTPTSKPLSVKFTEGHKRSKGHHYHAVTPNSGMTTESGTPFSRSVPTTPREDLALITSRTDPGLNGYHSELDSLLYNPTFHYQATAVPTTQSYYVHSPMSQYPQGTYQQQYAYNQTPFVQGVAQQYVQSVPIVPDNLNTHYGSTYLMYPQVPNGQVLLVGDRSPFQPAGGMEYGHQDFGAPQRQMPVMPPGNYSPIPNFVHQGPNAINFSNPSSSNRRRQLVPTLNIATVMPRSTPRPPQTESRSRHSGSSRPRRYTFAG